MKLRKGFGVICMLIGLAMLAGAGWLLYDNYLQDEAAGSFSAEMLASMKQELKIAAPTPAPTPAGIGVVPEETPVPEMSTMMIDGQECIGYLEMPTIEINLPVINDWNYDALKIAPCRYWGNVHDNTLVVLAHNYERHFSKIRDLDIGAPVQFVDADGGIHRFTVAAHEVLEPTDVIKMIESDYDATLFTCTYGGSMRAAVRLERVLAY